MNKKILLLPLLFFLLHAHSYAQSRLDSIRVQLKWYHKFQFAGYYAADIKGFYENEGLYVTFIEGGPNIDIVEKVINKNAELGIGDSGILLDYLNGKSIVALAALEQHTPAVILAKKEHGIETLQDLSSSNILIGSGEVEVSALFASEGFSSTKKNFIYGEYSLDRFINTDSLDAIYGYVTTEVPLLKERGIDVNAFYPSAYGVDFYGDILFTSQPLLNRSPRVIDRFLKATEKGWQYAKENENEVIDYILEFPGIEEHGYNKELLEKEAAATWEISIPDVVKFGYMNPDRWEQIASFYSETGIIEQNPDLSSFLLTPGQSFSYKLLSVLKYLIPGLLFIGISIWGWIITLRKEVEKRTQEWIKEHREKEQTQKALQKTEAKYQDLIDNIHDCVFSIDKNGVFTYVSPRVTEISGFTPDEITNTTRPAFIFREDQIKLVRRLRKRLDSNDDNDPIRIKTKSGAVKYVRATTRVATKKKQLIAYGTFRDITAQVRAENSLKRSEARFRMLTETSSVGIFMLIDDEYIFANDTYATIFGVEKKDLVGTKIDFSRIHEDDLPLLKENLGKLLRGEINRTSSTYRAFKQDNTAIIIEVYTTQIQIESEVVLFGMMLDITEKEQAKVKLQQSLQEKDIMLAEIHHRVKNNLAVISSLIELQAYEENEHVKEVLREAQLRIKTIALVHEEMYKAESLASLPFHILLDDLLISISNSLSTKNFDVQVQRDLSELVLNVNQAIPTALVVNEVITSFFKHSSGTINKPIISVKLSTNNDGLVSLVIESNLLGSKAELIKDSSLTASLIRNLTTQVNGTITFGQSSIYENGLYIQFSFKKNLFVSGSHAGKIVDR